MSSQVLSRHVNTLPCSRQRLSAEKCRKLLRRSMIWPFHFYQSAISFLNFGLRIQGHWHYTGTGNLFTWLMSLKVFFNFKKKNTIILSNLHDRYLNYKMSFYLFFVFVFFFTGKQTHFKWCNKWPFAAQLWRDLRRLRNGNESWGREIFS